MKKFFNYLILLFFLYIILQVIINSNIFITCIQDTIILWRDKVFPSLFPFILLSEFLINYGFINVINYIFGNIFSFIFNSNSIVAYIFFMSIISGFPSSSIYISDLYQKKIISLESSNKALMFCHFSNPLFIIGFIGQGLGIKCATYILLIHYLSSIIVGIIFRNYNNGVDAISKYNSKPFGVVLKTSITKGIDNLLLILGTIIFFNIIITSLNMLDLPIVIKFILNIFLELTNGLNFILNSIIDLKFKCVLIAMLLSFGGLCIHFQVISILENTKIKYQNYLLARIIQAIISGILVLITFN